MSDAALVLFSGGQDSTVALAWALDRFDRVETIGFDYRQRHAVELGCRQDVRGRLERMGAWGRRLGDDHLIDLGVLGQISDTALTRDSAITFAGDGLPSTFVPARNLIFFTLAAAVAYRRGITVLVGGMCETDFSGYPDCRDATIRALETAIALGTDRSFRLLTPLMWLDKCATWQLAETLGGEALVEIVAEATHTCYLGERGVRHAWGYGCGSCPACELRRKGYEAYRGRRSD